MRNLRIVELKVFTKELSKSFGHVQANRERSSCNANFRLAGLGRLGNLCQGQPREKSENILRAYLAPTSEKKPIRLLQNLMSTDPVQ